jgi:hypothetical protein
MAQTTKYEASNGTIHQIRMDAARIAVAGAAPGGAVDSPIKVKVSKSNREFGIRPRGVQLRRPINPGATDKIFRSFLPVLTETAFDSNTFALDAQITIGGTAWKIIGKVQEDY